MKIVITRRESFDKPDGINISVFSLTQAFFDLGHTITLITTDYTNPDKVREFFKIDSYPEIIALSDEQNLGNYRRLILWLTKGKRIVNNLSPDFVILNGAIPVSFKAPSCTVSHDLEKRLIGKSDYLRVLYKRFSYKRSTHIAVTCSELKPALANELSIPEDRLHILPTCFNLYTYDIPPLEEREKAVLHMGTVFYKKPEQSIRAFQWVKSPDTKLYITGRVTEYLQQVIEELDESLRFRIKLLGFVSAEELKRLLGSVRIISVPSDYVLPVASPTAIEGMASGTPVVGTSISTDVLRDGYNGFVCHDDKMVGERLETLLSDDILWQRMSNNALETSKHFSADQVAQKYLNLLTTEY